MNLVTLLQQVDGFFIDFFKKIKAAPSIGEKLDSYKGYGPGFDFCRVYLAISVMFWHGVILLSGTQMISTIHSTPVVWMLKYKAIAMFFALSGFLIAASAQRLSCGHFLLNRGLRIFPALIVEIILSVVVLGAIFTTLDIRDYWSDSQTFRYFLNIVGFVQFELPGVFKDNPINIVNGSLWTVPLEIACYALMTIIILAGLIKRYKLLFLAACVFPVLWFLFYYTHPEFDNTIPTHDFQLYLVHLFFTFDGVALIPCFLIGAALYSARYFIPHSRILLAISIAILFFVGLFLDKDFTCDPRIGIITNPLFVYIIIYLGLCKFPKLPFFSRGDYSYGIYLYAFPIQQALIHLWPTINFPVHFALSLLLVCLFAAFSWHCIEKPILGLRKNFSFIGRRAYAGE